MPSMEELLASVGAAEGEMVEALMELIRIPAIGPENGGDGEFERARYLRQILKDVGFDSVEMLDALDERVRLRFRPNLIARKKGQEERTVWIVSHMDTVPPGDLDAWETPPFAPRLIDGKLYGLGSEDNGQSLIASLFAAKAIIDTGEELGMSIGLVFVADEEAGNEKGIEFLMGEDLFKEDDIVIVPDFGAKDGSMIEVAEKSMLWTRVMVEGKQVHAANPGEGVNAMRVGSEFLVFLIDHLEKVYGDMDHLFRPTRSTFVPTKRLQTVGNVNTVPGEDVFYVDMRILPQYDPKDVLETARSVASLFEERSGAYITVGVEHMLKTADPSPIDGEAYLALSAAVKDVMGIEPEPIGIGGGTCANIFRRNGIPAYAWQTSDGMCHTPNEYCVVKNLVGDAKVFANLLARLCVPDIE